MGMVDGDFAWHGRRHHPIIGGHVGCRLLRTLPRVGWSKLSSDRRLLSGTEKRINNLIFDLIDFEDKRN